MEPRVHDRVHNSLTHINPAHAFPYFLFKICFNIVLPSTAGSSKWSRSFTFLHQNQVHISRATCPAYLVLLHAYPSNDICSE